MVEPSNSAPESVGHAWLEVLGRAHPLIVHFPIALSVVAALAVAWNWVRRHDGYGDFALQCTWIAAAAGALVAISGWFFAEADAAESRELFLHRWFGVGSAALLAALAAMTMGLRAEGRPGLLRVARLATIVAAIGVGLTAHFGGDMVWGEGLVSKPLMQALTMTWQALGGGAESAVAPPTEGEEPPHGASAMVAAMDDDDGDASDSATTPVISAAPPTDPSTPPSTPPATTPPPVIPKNLEYTKNIRPIFEARCWNCHGDGQAKGGVALDHIGELIVKDKKKGIIVASQPDASTLVKLIKRSATAKGRMPPKGERLTGEQIALIEAWIKQGAKVAE
jgi:uncharacterized membrane protein